MQNCVTGTYAKEIWIKKGRKSNLDIKLRYIGQRNLDSKCRNRGQSNCYE